MSPWQLVVLLGAFAIVCAMVIPRKKTESGQNTDDTVEQMQAALEHFMEQMEADSRGMVETIAQARKEQREDSRVQEQRIAALEQRCAELEQKLAGYQETAKPSINVSPPPLHSTDAGQERAEEEQVAEAAAELEHNQPIRERYAEVFDLHSQGKSVEWIAKKMAMNKGEVMLILQLAKQEEERRV
ncbi:hypothetical protein DNH61_22180 [Paenibacillus sambharensis]|uniref:Uncharacterized protein n=1 Tax=Paenibacillus sambharensis TaxID=1803190 RepID=A0A2W1L3B9_9BACL|nr:hypothetical protein [Paenibacillus sambharensis]PZD93349.1 hypothetical protein DNH61_22180 [Paenibacillus sambharensis]